MIGRDPCSIESSRLLTSPASPTRMPADRVLGPFGRDNVSTDSDDPLTRIDHFGVGDMSDRHVLPVERRADRRDSSLAPLHGVVCSVPRHRGHWWRAGFQSGPAHAPALRVGTLWARKIDQETDTRSLLQVVGSGDPTLFRSDLAASRNGWVSMVNGRNP